MLRRSFLYSLLIAPFVKPGLSFGDEDEPVNFGWETIDDPNAGKLRRIEEVENPTYVDEPIEMTGKVWWVDSNKKESGDGLSPETAVKDLDELDYEAMSGGKETVIIMPPKEACAELMDKPCTPDILKHFTEAHYKIIP